MATPDTQDQQTPSITPQITMGELLRHFPGARRALFARYHIGGCSSCGFSQDETLAAVCERNENVPVDEVIEHVKTSHEADLKLQADPKDIAEARENGEKLTLLDARTREEHEAVHIPDSRMLTQTLVQQIMGQWPRESRLVIYDHQGESSLDAAAFFVGHGFENVRALAGGIDRWSQEVDPTLPRYRLE